MKNTKILAVAATLIAFGGLTASAAALGGLTSTSLGADQTVVSSCDTDGVALAYTNTYNATTNAYDTTGVVLSGVNAACTGKSFKLTLAGASAAETSGMISGTSQSVALAAPIAAASITKAALVITG